MNINQMKKLQELVASAIQLEEHALIAETRARRLRQEWVAIDAASLALRHDAQNAEDTLQRFLAGGQQ